ncbi:MAG: hypothetical protein KDD36_09235 [Flavobacteriales bacterium]|nr:hypothetical protein [Flavobacteriales bacterium]
MVELKGGIFLSVKELMILTGKTRYEYARKEHKAIRDALGKSKRKLTVKEYCEYEGVPRQEVVEVLNAYR